MDAQRRNHQQSTSSIPEASLEQPNSAKTKGTMMTDEDNKEEATDDASHPKVEA